MPVSLALHEADRDADGVGDIETEVESDVDADRVAVAERLTLSDMLDVAVPVEVTESVFEVEDDSVIVPERVRERDADDVADTVLERDADAVRE